MSRKRSMDPAVRISFSMPRSLVQRLDHHLSYNASRSAFIAGAIKAKLSADDQEHDELTSHSLVDLIGLASSVQFKGQLSAAEYAVLDQLWHRLRELR